MLLTLTVLRTGLTEQAIAAVFGIPQSCATGPSGRCCPLWPGSSGREAVLILDGTLVPVHDQTLPRPSKNYRRSVNIQVMATLDRKIVQVSDAWPGNRNDIIVARATITIPPGAIVLTDGGYRSLPGATLPPRNSPALLTVHKRIRAEIEHVLARLKDRQILRQCRRRGSSINLAVRAVAYLWNLKLTTSSRSDTELRINS